MTSQTNIKTYIPNYYNCCCSPVAVPVQARICFSLRGHLGCHCATVAYFLRTIKRVASNFVEFRLILHNSAQLEKSQLKSRFSSIAMRHADVGIVAHI